MTATEPNMECRCFRIVLENRQFFLEKWNEYFGRKR